MKINIKHIYLVVGLLLWGNNYKSYAEINEFSAKVNGDIYGQVRVIDDVDGDGNKDIIFGGTDGKVHIFSSTGNEIFRPPYWPKQVDAPITAGIEVSDLDGKGNPNILVSTMNGTVYCLNSKGKELWNYSTGGKILVAPPVVADLGNNEGKGIVVTSASGRVVLLASDGREEMVFSSDHPVTATPVVADITHNGQKDILIKDCTGKISIFDRGGSAINEWFSGNYMTGASDWPFNIDVADINGDGIPEIFTTDPSNSNGVFKMWDNEGKLISGFALSEAAHGAPKIADVDGDGIDDFIIAQCDGKVIVCDKNGKPKKGWPFENDYTIYSAPSIIDIDGDGNPEIIFTCNKSSNQGLQAGCIVALNGKGEMMEDFPKYIGKTIAPLTFADLDGDGTLEIIAAGGIGYTGPQLHVFKTKAKVKIKIVTIRQQTNFK